MTKVRILLPFVQGNKAFGFGEEISLDQTVAYKLALKNVLEFKNKKEFTELDTKIKAQEKEALEEKEEAENRATAILEKDYLDSSLIGKSNVPLSVSFNSLNIC